MEIMEMMGGNRAKIWEFFDNFALKNRFFVKKNEFFFCQKSLYPMHF
jgi:hypothetical protein